MVQVRRVEDKNPVSTWSDAMNGPWVTVSPRIEVAVVLGCSARA